MYSTIKVRNSTHRALRGIASLNRMKLIATMDALVEGWLLLDREQQICAIRMDSGDASAASSSNQGDTDNGQSGPESVAKPTIPAPESIPDTDSAPAPTTAESKSSTSNA